MSFISYAQNFEDVILWRALKHIEQGFYIDVGANDPTIDSVTKAFYERGWRGINIEPLESHYNDLQVERPRDINLCCAAGETSGEIEIFECDIRGWATAEQSVADKYVQEGHEGVYHRVPLRMLSDICQEYVSGEIHFLKIDVEGLEKDVISGADFQKFRPWIVVVEASKPNSTEEVHEQWESLLLAVSYQFAYADGLNHFYVASERADLLPAFKYPPNVFDGFALNVQHQAEARAAGQEQRALAAEARAAGQEQRALAAEARAAGQEQRATAAEARANKLQTDLDAVHAANHHHWQLAEAREQQIQAIYQSHSWRITAPLRWCGHQARLVRQHGLALRLKALVKKIVRPSVRCGAAFLSARPGLRLRCVALIRRFGLYDPLRSFYFRCSGQQYPRNSPSEVGQGAVSNLTVDQLPPRARQIYADLKAAIENHNKENR